MRCGSAMFAPLCLDLAGIFMRPGLPGKRVFGILGSNRKRGNKMAKIPASLREPIDTAFPANVILVGSVQPDGYAQITPRGSAQVYDDEHISLWERGRGSTNAAIADGTKLTFFLRSPQLRASGALPNGGIA